MNEQTRSSQKQLGDARIAETMSSRHDRWRDHVALTYLICTSPRVGSHMLSFALAEAGGGKAVEYLHPTYIGAYTARLGVKEVRFDDYMQFLKHNRASDSGVFGLKSHFHQVRDIFKQQDQILWFIEQFDKIIFLRRRSKVRQAVSYARAASSGTWFAGTSGEAETARRLASSYNSGAIADALAFTMNDDRNWKIALGRSGKPVHVLYYEDLVANYAAEVGKVCAHVGLPSGAMNHQAPLTQILGDDLNTDWEQRFRQEIAGETP